MGNTTVKSANIYSLTEIGVITPSISLMPLKTINNLANFYNFWAKAKKLVGL